MLWLILYHNDMYPVCGTDIDINYFRMNMLSAFLGCNFILSVDEKCTSPEFVAFC